MIAAILNIISLAGSFLLGLWGNSKEKEQDYQNAIEQSYAGGPVMADIDRDLDEQLKTVSTRGDSTEPGK